MAWCATRPRRGSRAAASNACSTASTTRTGREHVDNLIRIHHLAPDSHSDQFYKGVVDGRAHAVFAGKIIVHQDAQKTNAYQKNDNLLLSDDAEIDTKPELEIYADDVKCSHGATCGDLDPTALFYLRSRGLPRAAAESVLTFAFAAEVIERFADPTVRQHVRKAAVKRLPGGSDAGGAGVTAAAARVVTGRATTSPGCAATSRSSRTRMNDRPLVYLDTAASAQKPRAVIDTLKRFYEQDYANIHRGVYDLSQRATAADDAARRKVQRFVNAADWREIVFTRNATEAINLVAASFLRPQLQPGDEILVTEMEHHANIVPWQMAAEATGAKVVAAPVSDAGELILDAFVERITERTRMIAVAWVSNVLGTVNPVHELVAHRACSAACRS